MFNPNNPFQFYLSYNGRKLVRYEKDAIAKDGLARMQVRQKLPVTIKSSCSRIFKNFKPIRKELFINKLTNLRLALESINGLVIQSGETFSFWDRVGKPSYEKGYLPGLVIDHGEPDEAVGGGLGQLANMIHWLALHSDLEIIERHRHKFDVFPDDNRLIPFATGATIQYNNKDLRVHNPTQQDYQLNFDLSDQELSGSLDSEKKQTRSFQIEERDPAFIKTNEDLYRSNYIYQIITDHITGNREEKLILENYCKCNYRLEELFE